MTQLPLYQRTTTSPTFTDGKVPLEEWPEKELISFRDELQLLQMRMEQVRETLNSEALYINQLREKEAYPISVITESEYNNTAGLDRKTDIGLYIYHNIPFYNTKTYFSSKRYKKFYKWFRCFRKASYYFRKRK